MLSTFNKEVKVAQNKLTQERKGQIALLILKEKMAHHAISLNRQQFNEQIEDGSKGLEKIGVTKDEFLALYEEIIRENVEKMFAK